MRPSDKALIAAAALALLSAGCRDQAPTEQQNGDAARTDIDVLPADESVSTPTNDLVTGVIDTPPRENAPAPNPKTAIPSVLHGRWGVTPSDCSSERGESKGLITISAASISFYESVARPAEIYKATPTSIHGEFAFIGEGMAWTNPMRWSVDGNKLTRIDSEEESRLVYTRC